ncbi:MAG: cobalt ECF transporter T component CbiQ [Acidimicrobiia bacterium]|nr:MAG: cobalt ECF transporter T component CbiQ [Acidimicrobiia bacterium]
MSGTHLHVLHVHGHSPVHRLAPEVKVVAMLAFVVGVVATPREALWAFAIHAFFLVAVISFAELPFGFVFRRMMIEVPFVAFAVALPFLGGGPRIEVAGVLVSLEGLWGAWNILAKGTLGVGASVVLVATTEIPEILRGLDRLRVPRLLTSVAGFMIRYIEVLASELRRTRTAMASRGHDARWLWQVGPLAASAGALFVRSYERGERVYQAMLSRGYDGTMPQLDERRARGTEWAAALGLPLTTWMVALLAIVGS